MRWYFLKEEKFLLFFFERKIFSYLTKSEKSNELEKSSGPEHLSSFYEHISQALEGTGIKILKMFQRLPIAFAHVEDGDTSKDLLNDILWSRCRHHTK